LSQSHVGVATARAFPRAGGRIVYGFTGRAGGVSAAPFATLNLSYTVGDHPAVVDANWQRLRASQSQELLFMRLRQVHGADVRIARTPETELGAGDAAITALMGAAVGVLTADCVPILLSAAGGEVVAAVHAGWRGTAADVVGKTIQAISEHFGVPASSCEAAIGPAIGRCCYEVGAEVVTAFATQADILSQAPIVEPIPAAAGKFRADLRAANAALLHRAGLPRDAIFQLDACTCCDADTWFSHRAAGGGATGRQLSWIARVAG